MAGQPKATFDNMVQNAGKWLTVRQLAKMLAVHPDTVRRWAERGLIKSVRHPANNYRLFLADDLVSAESLRNEG